MSLKAICGLATSIDFVSLFQGIQSQSFGMRDKDGIGVCLLYWVSDI